MKNSKPLSLYVYSIKVRGEADYREVSRRWCKEPTRTTNWRRLNFMLGTYNNIEQIRYTLATPRF
jgi:hypothetical protein